MAQPNVAVSIHCHAWLGILPDAAALCERATRGALSGTSGAAAEVSVVLADDALLRDLNRRYRGKDAPTNVLAFPADSAVADGPGEALLGDVVVAFETTAREAEAQGKRLADHLCHLVVHGTLHLLGHDHQDDTRAARMERLEADILERLGIANPYGTGDRCENQTTMETARQ